MPAVDAGWGERTGCSPEHRGCTSRTVSWSSKSRPILRWL